MLAGNAWVLIALFFFVALLATIRWAAGRYKKVPPSKLGIIYGRKQTIQVPDGQGGTKTETVGFKVFTGGGALIIPILEEYGEMSLNARQIPVHIKDAPNKDGVMVTAEGNATAVLGPDQSALITAVQTFEGMNDVKINEIIQQTLEGQLRAIVGRLSIEELNSDREKLNVEVLQGSEHELLKLGVKIKILTIHKITDQEGYIEALGKKRVAEVKRDAIIGEAQATKDSDIAKSTALREAATIKAENDAQIAEAERALSLKRANIKAEVDRQNAIASLAGDLARAEREIELKQRQVEVETSETEARTTLAEKEGLRRERELAATVLTQAEADKKAKVISAEADKQAKIINATADQETAAMKATAITTQAEAEADAERKRGQGKADATKATMLAEAEGTKAKQLADADGVRARQLAEAEGDRARRLAEAEGVGAKLKAEADGLESRLMAEARGKRELAEALAKLDETGRLLQVLEAAPHVAEAVGAALAKALGPEGAANIFGQMAAPFSSVDKIHIIDMAGSNGNGHGAIGKLASVGPNMLFELLANAKAAGFNFDEILSKFGLSSNLLSDLGLDGDKSAKKVQTVKS